MSVWFSPGTQLNLPFIVLLQAVLPCAPAPHCMTLRLPGYLREEFFDYKSLYWFAGLSLVQVKHSYSDELLLQ
ncbi:hypothetical protein T265_06838 [Opisthorchis viverrini]|uniref:Secreted protein n=1 Tax=Opisthorchis viverrini TaxID=6198 RepID=A0A075ACZ4_OPIVI|nr:hypothetical protein T265_06838 [Opisthorchis viverrini]KER25734.1 hypothetical protein T265_06838 [Opisthorchis viverrini]